jgi:hypothetical protein
MYAPLVVSSSRAFREAPAGGAQTAREATMSKRSIAWAGASILLLIPLLGSACESGDRRRCKEEFSMLVSYRTEAMETAFGAMFGALPERIQIKFVSTKDAEYELYGGDVAYDRENRTIIFPRRVLGSKTPNPLRWAAYYWPFYENEQYRQTFPVIETIDNVLLSAYMQEAANLRGLPWPHKGCSSLDLAKRLPCEMLVQGIAEHLTAIRSPLFNSNRLDRIWPDDFSTFRRRAWRHGDQEYVDVQKYGGILLIKPLVAEFGVPRTLEYVAQTPFQVEDNNLRVSALHYQELARQTLTTSVARVTPPVASNGRRYASWQSAADPAARQPERAN